VVSEGFDVPAASCAILLRPTQSLGLYLQQVGRVLRPAPGKDAAIVLDHVGNAMRHGFPDDARDWSLDDRMRRSKGTPAPSVRTCPECFAAFKPAPICPLCGAQCVPIKSRVIRELAGELQELKRAEQRTARREQGQARTLADLLMVAKNRGYSPGWAYRIAAARGKR
jgi:superfamily II DNA or RNA helicase